MSDKIKIAIDAMGGEKAPKKIIEAIEISLKSNQENFFYLYGKQNLIEKEISIPSIIFLGEFSPPIVSIAIFTLSDIIKYGF